MLADIHTQLNTEHVSVISVDAQWFWRETERYTLEMSGTSETCCLALSSNFSVGESCAADKLFIIYSPLFNEGKSR